MEIVTTREKGFVDLKKACKTVLSEKEFCNVETHCLDLVLHRMRKPDEKFFVSNMYLVSLYRVLPKDRFDAVQEEWIDIMIREHKDEIFAPSVLETLVNYHDLFSGVDIKVEPDGKGARITMKDGCMYSIFCNETENRRCLRGIAIKQTVNYNGSMPVICYLERPPESHECILRAKDVLESYEVLEEYRRLNKPITIL